MTPMCTDALVNTCGQPSFESLDFLHPASFCMKGTNHTVGGPGQVASLPQRAPHWDKDHEVTKVSWELWWTELGQRGDDVELL